MAFFGSCVTLEVKGQVWCIALWDTVFHSEWVYFDKCV